MAELNTLDVLNVLSFVMSCENYQQNLTQNDKQDLMNEVDLQTEHTLTELKKEIHEQNKLLFEILERLEMEK